MYGLFFLALGACATDFRGDALWNELEPLPQLTPPDIALRNLNGQIEGIGAAYRRHPQDELARQLVDLYSTRFQFLANVEDLESLLSLASERYQATGHSTQTLLLYVDANTVAHRFTEALLALEDGGVASGHASVADKRRSVQFIVGDAAPESVAAMRREVAKHYPGFDGYAEYASALALAGEFERADEAYTAAALAYRDVSPFPYAWLSFQRGLMWCEMADDCDRALPYYRRSVQIFPDYVVANVHLAELEIAHGDHDRARRRLKRLLRDGIDPEVPALLAEITIDEKEREALIERALAGYTARLDRHYLAYADHAAEFFAGMGDNLELAVELATSNLANRYTDRALSLAIEVGVAADDISLICMVHHIADSRSYAPKNRLLTVQLNNTVCCEGCGDYVHST